MLDNLTQVKSNMSRYAVKSIQSHILDISVIMHLIVNLNHYFFFFLNIF